MPILKRSPEDLTGACVNRVNEETGEYNLRGVLPEDVLAGMSRGRTSSEIAVDLGVPVNIVEHAISQVPLMMAWRNMEAEKDITSFEDANYLPELPNLPEVVK